MQNKKNSPLFTLPAEVKDIIYRKMIDAKYIAIQTPEVRSRNSPGLSTPWALLMAKHCYNAEDTDHPYPKADPSKLTNLSILRVSKETYEEARYIAYEKLVLFFNNVINLNTFLGSGYLLRSNTTQNLTVHIKFIKLVDWPKTKTDLAVIAKVLARVPEELPSLATTAIWLKYRGKADLAGQLIPFKTPQEIQSGMSINGPRKNNHDGILETVLKIMDMPRFDFIDVKWGAGAWSKDEKRVWRRFANHKIFPKSKTEILEEEWKKYVASIGPSVKEDGIYLTAPEASKQFQDDFGEDDETN